MFFISSDIKNIPRISRIKIAMRLIQLVPIRCHGGMSKSKGNFN